MDHMDEMHTDCLGSTLFDPWHQHILLRASHMLHGDEVGEQQRMENEVVVYALHYLVSVDLLCLQVEESPMLHVAQTHTKVLREIIM